MITQCSDNYIYWMDHVIKGVGQEDLDPNTGFSFGM
jgi:hypothetical protein